MISEGLSSSTIISFNPKRISGESLIGRTINTNDVEPLTSIAETTLKFRKDEVKSENIREKILKNSPSNNKDFFVVPKVVE